MTAPSCPSCGVPVQPRMKALWLHQPYPTLIELGVKSWETRGGPPNGPMRPDGVRGMPGLPIEPGERIAIVASKTEPTVGEEVGGWYWENTAADPECIVRWRGPWVEHPAPLGVVVCTAVVAEALPIVDAELGWQLDTDTPHRAILVDGPADPLLVVDAMSPHSDWDISDQLPYGDWTPGRWAWRLTDVESVPSRPEPVVTRGNRQGVCEIEVTW